MLFKVTAISVQAACVGMDANPWWVDTDVAVPPDSLRIITTISASVSCEVRISTR